ncbi:MAG TPA: glycoside hydrolase family 31 protein [Candidatus Competibacter sp.]|nr:glycoside hydrolase family 31 protein [Candidatus Competibacter sp.]HUM93759.1 glycoside hydrolase family 31 protein [Candidatus Competibacter sp.]
MFFDQKIHPLNFDYPEQLSVDGPAVELTGSGVRLRVACALPMAGCLRLRFENARETDPTQYSDAVIPDYQAGAVETPVLTDGAALFETAEGRVELRPRHLHVGLAGVSLSTVADGIGGCGEALLLNFALIGAKGCYGLGERAGRFNKLGERADFLTVDVVAVFKHTYARDDYDPTYVAIPLAVLQIGERFLGLFFDNPHRAIMDVGKTKPGEFWYQSFGGVTDLYLLAGPTLAEVTRRYAALTGRAPLPPLWALGYHQCRWGYQREREFRELAERFAAADVPVSALWYDIDYMDDYRLFTWDRNDFPDPAGLNRDLKEAGIRAVTIVDPGVKREPGYAVYDSGREQRVFCQTASGRDYVGKVWPGDTVFPDFSLESTRAWWADWLARFLRESAVDGVWLDMNDPATGYSRTEEMRFQHGAAAHERYHNQYAHFMAAASRAACEQLDPQGRPFLLTRSACAGTQRHTAVWTGDNASNWQHLQMALPCSLNLSLSGVAFNGPDVGGFMDDTNAELLVRWHQACCLFPFFRNHSMRDSRLQEPWQFGPAALAAIRGAIRLRYRLLPYLYQCFFAHWRDGDPVIRPLLYHDPHPDYAHINDQYLLGEMLLVAPILHGEGQGPETIRHGIKYQERMIALPPGWWFDLNHGVWVRGGRMLNYAAALDELPLFVRDGAVLPYYAGPLRNSLMDLSAVELHVFCHDQPARLDYALDDRETRGYEAGAWGVACISAELHRDGLQMEIAEKGNYPRDTVRFSPVVYGRPDLRDLRLAVNGRSDTRNLQADQREWLCRTLPVRA